jgi:hypothetical protein
MSSRVLSSPKQALGVAPLVAASIAVAVLIVLFAFSLSYGLRISAAPTPRAAIGDAGAG